MKAELVFNLDKVGKVDMSEWEDRKIGRSKGQENDRPEDDGQSYDTSSRIRKREAYVNNNMYHRWKRVPDVLQCDIAGLRASSQDADVSRRSYGH
jgi:hypothetical protein